MIQVACHNQYSQVKEIDESACSFPIGQLVSEDEWQIAMPPYEELPPEVFWHFTGLILLSERWPSIFRFDTLFMNVIRRRSNHQRNEALLVMHRSFWPQKFLV